MEGCDKCVVRDATIISLQDTLLWSGRIYADNCFIEGNVDFIWGTGAAYFENCEIRTLGRTGYIVQARNPTRLRLRVRRLEADRRRRASPATSWRASTPAPTRPATSPTSTAR